MTNQEEWTIREARGRNRFKVPTYIIKDQYNDPNAPYFCAAHFIDADNKGGVMSGPISKIVPDAECGMRM
jgi:hypothetical protein